MRRWSAEHRHRFSSGSVLAHAIAAVLLLAAIGCSRAGRIEKANDELRQENMNLKQQVAELIARNKELESELHRGSGQPTTLPEDIRENIPHVTAIEIGRLSFAHDSDGDGRNDTLTIYLNPTDGRGRFTQLVGTVSISAASVSTHADASTIGRASFTPAQVRDAYRSALTGTHYVFEVPINLTSASAAPPDRALVTAEYIDGVTGEKFSTERSVSLK